MFICRLKDDGKLSFQNECNYIEKSEYNCFKFYHKNNSNDKKLLLGIVPINQISYILNANIEKEKGELYK